jgi:signal transduction histidine kinase
VGGTPSSQLCHDRYPFPQAGLRSGPGFQRAWPPGRLPPVQQPQNSAIDRAEDLGLTQMPTRLGVQPSRGGALGSLARALARARREPDGGPRSGSQLRPLLQDLTAELGVRGLDWLPDDGHPGEAWPVHRPGTIDWNLAGRVAPAEVHLVGEEDRRRSPRLAAGEGRELYVRTGPGVVPSGVLRVVSDRSLTLGRAAFVALAELVSSTAAAAEGDGSQSRRERDLGRRVAALTHDLRNQVTLALLHLERQREEPGTQASLDQLEDVLCAARDLCQGSLTGEDARAPRRLLLRSILLEEARAAGAVSRAKRGVSVQARCSLDLAVNGELVTLARLVRNLIVNAVEASAEGGLVRVQGVALPDGRVAVVVEDGGRGMSAERVHSLLAPGRCAGGGTGYGGVSLLECLGRLDAECEVHTAPGAGTRFEVRLPGAPPRDRPSLLLLDPDFARRRMRCTGLIESGLGAWTASHPAAALELLRAGRPAGLLVARGTHGTALASVLDQAARAGVPVSSLPAGQMAAATPRPLPGTQ